MTKKALIISILFICSLPFYYLHQCYALPADNVVPLINDQYFSKVHKVLRNAQRSIFCVMYLAKLPKNRESGYTKTLVRDLINAHKRGVDVKVILDQNINFWAKGKYKGHIERKSSEAYRLLLKANVPVYYDDKKQITHNKIIVVDNYITIVGSTNWTYSALNKNNEASVLIESEQVAKEFTRWLHLIPRDKVK